MSDNNFNSIISNYKKVIVYFYAPWCKYCVDFAPEYEKLVEYYRDKIYITKLDGDKYKNISKEQNVLKFPTIILYVGGKGNLYEGPNTPIDLKFFIDNLI